MGGSSGIGTTIALGLGQAGTDVAATSRRMEMVNSVADEIESFGRRSLRATCDVTERTSLEKVLQACLDTFGKVDILINAAGITKRVPTVDFPESECSKIMDTNLTGALRACQVFGRHRVDRQYGRIINIASMGHFADISKLQHIARARRELDRSHSPSR
jgi:NAD(P)-dependent dehydrogenase (short-subunit alcohol dehydrogenase family)